MFETMKERIRLMHLMHFHNRNFDPIPSMILLSTVYDIRYPNPLYYQLPAGKFPCDRHLSFFHASLQLHLHFTPRILRILRREDCARVAGCKHPQ